MMVRLDISVGPVQGFVAQSRRTRDLWGSSYLLSFLAGSAMRGAELAGGRIVRPDVEHDPLYRCIRGEREGEAPHIGSLPNRFAIELNGDPPEVAHAAQEALHRAWHRVCRAVWGRFVEHAYSLGNGTDTIWNRQVNDFWEISWTAGDPASNGGLLARRKRWRITTASDEHGDKCTVMHDLQELSGYVGAESPECHERQREFWNCIRERTGPLDLLDTTERLCSIAIVKRLFAKVSKEALGWEVDSSHWPSTVHIGAVPWLQDVVSTAPEKARKFADSVRNQSARPTDAFVENYPPFKGLDAPTAGDFLKLDPNWFYRDFVASQQPVHPTGNEVGTALVRQLEAIYRTKDHSKNSPLGQPASFYGLLLADGDRLGSLVGRIGSGRVGQALAEFTQAVQGIVREHDGVTVYAGGDDVLAMLPVRQALACAAALSEKYRKAFKSESEATLSAAVVFGHIRLPLQTVIGECHRLLDAVAKDENGRDSLAVAVLKRSGLNCQWVTTWERMNHLGVSGSAVTMIDQLTARISTDMADPSLPSTLIYRIKQTLSRLCDLDRWTPGNWCSLPDELNIHSFIRAEVFDGLTGRSSENADRHSAELADLVATIMRRSPAWRNGDGLGIDALLLARFLADPTSEEFD